MTWCRRVQSGVEFFSVKKKNIFQGGLVEKKRRNKGPCFCFYEMRSVLFMLIGGVK